MADIFTQSQWLTDPVAYWSLGYEKKRSGSDMQYRFSWKVWLKSSTAWYYDALELILNIGGTNYTVNVKGYNSGEKGWSKSGTTGWYTVANKTSGTVGFYAVIRDSSKSEDKHKSSVYQLAVDPAIVIVTGAEDFNSGDPNKPSITFSNPGGLEFIPYINFYDRNNENIKYYAVSRELSNGYTSPYTFTLTAEEKTEILNACSNDNEFIVYEGAATPVGSRMEYNSIKQKFTVEESDDTKPILTMTTALNNEGLPSSFAGLYIQGKSRVDVTLSAEGRYNASIQEYSVQIDGKVYPHAIFTSDVIQTPGNLQITGSVRDSRGFSRSSERSVTVIEYTAPSVVNPHDENAVTCYRSDGNGNKVSNGTSVWVKAKRSYSKVISNGSQKNFCRLQWRRRSADGWSEWADLISGASTGSDEYNALISDTVFDINKAYTVQIRAIDDFNESDVKTLDIPTGDVALHLGRGGNVVSVGKYCDYTNPNSFQVNWDVYLKNADGNGLVKLDYIVEQGTSEGWRYTKWESGKLELCCSPTFITVGEWKAWGTLYESSNRIQAVFPISFLADTVPVISATLRIEENLGGWLECQGNATNEHTQTFIWCRPNSNIDVNSNWTVDISAIGRWK